MMTRLWSLALAIAWSVDAIFLYMLAEAQMGSVLFRLFAAILIWLAVLALGVAYGRVIWQLLERVAVRIADRWLDGGLPSLGRLSWAGLPARSVALGRRAIDRIPLGRAGFPRLSLARMPRVPLSWGRLRLAARSQQIVTRLRAFAPHF